MPLHFSAPLEEGRRKAESGNAPPFSLRPSRRVGGSWKAESDGTWCHFPHPAANASSESGTRKVLGSRGHGGGGKTEAGNRKARSDLVPSAEPTTFLCFVGISFLHPIQILPCDQHHCSGIRKAESARALKQTPECDGASMRNVDRRDGKVALPPLPPCCKTAEACGEAAVAS